MRPDTRLREAIQSLNMTATGLLRRFAPRNDGNTNPAASTATYLTDGIDLFADLNRVGSRRVFFKAFPSVFRKRRPTGGHLGEFKLFSRAALLLCLSLHQRPRREHEDAFQSNVHYCLTFLFRFVPGEGCRWVDCRRALLVLHLC